ncbi:hypothetical protein D5086_033566 [Populus alba]|uniref:Uncharacterized protein n=1 Tax=Populus alba TaxID=43335 RepID=A0ACC4AH85_POPAL
MYQRFIPSDFGIEEDRVSPLPPFQAFLDRKRKQCPIDCLGTDITVYGDGQAKAVLNYEEDVAMYTIKVADDARTLNRVVTYQPPKNIVSQLELISLWEKKTGLPPPQNIPVSILHSVFIKGDMTGYELGDDDLEASQLYPDYEYTTFDKLLDIFLIDPPEPAMGAFE